MHTSLELKGTQVQNFPASYEYFQSSCVAAKVGRESLVYRWEETEFFFRNCLPTPTTEVTQASQSPVQHQGAPGCWAGSTLWVSRGRKEQDLPRGASCKEQSVLIPPHPRQCPRVRMCFLQNVHWGQAAWPGGLEMLEIKCSSPAEKDA